MGLELQDVLHLWLVLRYQDGSTKIIQNCSEDLTTASLSLVERYRAVKTKFHFENDESASPVEIVYSSQSRQACEDFVNDTILATDNVYFQNRQNSVPDIRDVVTNCLNPLATSIKFLERDMQRLQGVVNALHEMNIEKFWSEPLNIDGDIKVRPQLAENTREESENGQKSKKKKKKKAKKVEELDGSSRDTTPGPPSLSGPLNSGKNDDEEQIEYTLKKFGDNLKPMGEIRKRSSFKHPDPLITAFCVFREERGVKFQSVKKVPDEKNTFKATILVGVLKQFESI
uniref:Ras-associating domain-containing protein n=1 Tax=Bursaphelenchus xylophilus TaxID=6326 RepID=A0A1I7SER1_BURXY